MAKLIGSGRSTKEGNSWTVYLGFLILFCLSLIALYSYIQTLWGGLGIMFIDLVISFLLFREDATTAYMWLRVQLRNCFQHPNYKDIYGFRIKDIPNLKKIVERKKNEVIR